ncbi:hypothetical protein H6F88_19215 [Oculatella sp. FACHB-28]|uniref:hypothetical protein n=1 Tax=Oculatella sp. FACHB-28 TaxID=2692845 RepID=UPI00168900C5|nr:hypothetical protein [Oculatella sp. FACHB-28]MBD2058116.1 hypothetical protein [Oculatella sp. FACHB-28]
MRQYLELLETLKILKAEKNRIGNEGNVLLNSWVAQSKRGGTAEPLLLIVS